MKSGPLRILLIHPRLGLGGAERWVVDTAVGLQQMGHRVTIYTNGYRPEHAFADIRNHNLDVKVVGRWLPGHLFQRFKAPCTILGMAWLALTLRRSREGCDLLLCDLVAHVTPLLDRRLHRRVVYYCHYPDRLLTPSRRGLYQLYRAPIDRMELKGLASCHHILVNSRFTATAFRRVFPELASRPVDVVYPGIDVASFDWIEPLPEDPRSVPHLEILVLGRFHPDKNLLMAIEMLSMLRKRPGKLGERLRLILAGGFDRSDGASRKVVAALKHSISAKGLDQCVEICPNPSDNEKAALYRRAWALIHTAPAEHFGLVPLEAMAAARPVVAVAAAGPRETITDGETGELCEPTVAAFASALGRLIDTPGLARAQGIAGRERVRAEFARERCAASILSFVRDSGQ